jgi:hypothetical protein
MGHCCATSRYLLLILEPDEENQEVLEEIEHQNDTGDIYFHLSPQALTGQPSPRTLKFYGKLYGLPVSVLIDTENTHNILQSRIANHLHMPHTPIPKFSVMVGNGSRIQCSGFCPNVPLALQNTTFHVPFYLLPIEGADVVLGLKWLGTLGPILADFSIPSLSFTHENLTITLHGDTPSQPTPSTFHHICHLLHTDYVASMHLLTCTPTTQTEPPPHSPISLPTSIPIQIRNLLQKYATIF